MFFHSHILFFSLDDDTHSHIFSPTFTTFFCFKMTQIFSSALKAIILAGFCSAAARAARLMLPLEGWSPQIQSRFGGTSLSIFVVRPPYSRLYRPPTLVTSCDSLSCRRTILRHSPPSPIRVPPSKMVLIVDCEQSFSLLRLAHTYSSIACPSPIPPLLVSRRRADHFRHQSYLGVL